ncbi:NAD(P)/FAD-dependent oxidoreductase [Thermaurantimonas aggregans]|uniref:NAD(P)/FAD-dependent oxidoreductase n=1 Tax=Thermaurantimonas aggregans TaxID=2173829 RepID=UPI0023F43551|nr:FAD-dependent oxidoreductase [Thermaurantimonas aggregans]MCX8149112.1 FAD-dependent oxidoreductase [Thermaurantimonas aggregans]
MKTVVVGGNFAGLTTALELKRKLKDQVNVLVIDKSPVFTFIPSLIWVPFKRRDIKDITLDRKKILNKKGIDFLRAEALKIDPDKHVIYTTEGEVSYDQLVIATGPKVDFDVAPGVRQYAYYVGTQDGAMKIRKRLEEFVKNPGPIVVGATQYAGCMGAGYEFLFNIDHWLRKNNIRDRVKLTWITPEPYLGHFGIEGMTGAEAMLKRFLKMLDIDFRTEAAIKEVTPTEVILESGEAIPSVFTMLMPPFIGVDLIKNSPQLEPTSTGYLQVDDTYRHPKYPNIWAAGIAVNVVPPFKPGKVPFGSPKTGFPSDETGKIVAENIARMVRGEQKLKAKKWGDIPAICVLDSGNKEVIIFGNKLFKPRAFAIMLPNILGDFSKVLFEKYFLWKTRNGYSFLP